MKIDNRALIFGGILVAVVLVVGAGVWAINFFGAQSGTNGERTPVDFFAALFPFGQNTGDRNNQSGSENGAITPGGAAPSLREISHVPVGGAHFKSDGIVRYVESETGHIFETAPKSLSVTRISNTTIPRIQNAVWFGDRSFILQYLDESNEIKNYLASLASSTPDQALIGDFVTGTTGAFSVGNDEMFYESLRSDSGLVVYQVDTKKKTREAVFISPIRSWGFLPTTGGLFVESAPSSGIGYLYQLQADQSLKKIVGNISGLMAVPNATGTYVAFSTTNAAGTSLYVINTETSIVSRSPVSTLAEKCAWVPGKAVLLFCGVPAKIAGVSVESWLMGTQSLSDDAWLIDPIRGSAQILRSLEKETGRAIDIENPQVSPDGAYALFMNKNDLSLWSLSLSE